MFGSVRRELCSLCYDVYIYICMSPSSARILHVQCNARIYAMPLILPLRDAYPSFFSASLTPQA